jgi:hypothetical protein
LEETARTVARVRTFRRKKENKNEAGEKNLQKKRKERRIERRKCRG